MLVTADTSYVKIPKPATALVRLKSKLRLRQAPSTTSGPTLPTL